MQQYDKEEMARKSDGRERSTRVRRHKYYRDPDFEKVMYSSGDELSDMDDACEEDSGEEYCVDDYASDDSQ